MVRCFLLSWQGMVWAGLSLALWAAAARAGAARPAGGRYDTATPHSPPYRPYKYIPLQSSYDRYSPDNFAPSPTETDLTPGGGGGGGGGGMAPSELILTALRTALDIVRKVNASRRTTSNVAAKNSTAVAVRRNSTAVVSGRGMDYYDDHDHDHDHHPEPTTTARPARPRYTDPWAGYYDWIINEGSFKFWSVFQIFTAALLLYACLSAIYYAKFNPIIPDYDREYDDYFLERTVGRQARSLDSWELPSGSSWINPRTFQFILDAISKHYENYED